MFHSPFLTWKTWFARYTIPCTKDCSGLLGFLVKMAIQIAIFICRMIMLGVIEWYCCIQISEFSFGLLKHVSAFEWLHCIVIQWPWKIFSEKEKQSLFFCPGSDKQIRGKQWSSCNQCLLYKPTDATFITLQPATVWRTIFWSGLCYAALPKNSNLTWIYKSVMFSNAETCLEENHAAANNTN